MRPDGLLSAVALIIEEVCHSHHDRETGLRASMTREEMVAIRERIDTLIIMNLPREASDE